MFGTPVLIDFLIQQNHRHSSTPSLKNIKHTTVEYIIASFLHQFFLQFMGSRNIKISTPSGSYYRPTRGLLTLTGGVGDLGIIVSVAAYAVVAPARP
jgi:hypothetical protein